MAAGLCAASVAIASCANPAAGTPAGPVDLAASSTAFGPSVPAGSTVTEGGTLQVSVTVKNLKGSAVVANAYSVAFYLASGSTFSPGSDPLLAPSSALTLPDIGANGSVTIDATLTMPSGSAATPYLNQCDYIYAVVTATGDTTVGNDTTPANDSLIVLLGATTPPSIYTDLVVETYSPDGTSPTGNPTFGIYNSGNSTHEGWYIGPGYGKSQVLSLPSGTYYIAVWTNGPGPYALVVRSMNVTHRTFTAALASDPDSTNDNSPPIASLNQLYASGSFPSSLNTAGAKVLTIGEAVNWWAATDETDWFKFTLP